MAVVPEEIISMSRAAAVMVRIHGPDPKARKMRHHAFYYAESGDTTLSASGLLIFSNSSLMVITCGSIVEPFLTSKSHGGNKMEKLIAGAELDVLMETSAQSNEACWLPCQLLKLVEVPEAAKALQDLFDVQGGSFDGIWEMGWALTQVDGNSQIHSLGAETMTEKEISGGVSRLWTGHAKEMAFEDLVQTTSAVASAATRIAVLSLVIDANNFRKIPSMVFSSQCQRGDYVMAVGSPFGALSPLHFFNSVSVGCVSNYWPSTSTHTSLLVADVRCLPGMEGGPVFDKSGALVGMLIKPLHHRSASAEVQLVITSNALAIALEAAEVNVHRDNSQIVALATSSFDQTAIQEAAKSVVLVTVGDGAWASGVVLNRTGLILTNAHLLEPWRFGKSKTTQHHQHHHLQIRVRFDERSSMCVAKAVFVSQGSLDFALLQLNDAHHHHHHLLPIEPEWSEPIQGSTAVVIGHGLFGPRALQAPSVSAGVVSRVLNAGVVMNSKGICQAINTNNTSEGPVMLQTTAAVHSGGSGGVVVNSYGRMLGLVTSHAKHSGGSVLPHLNFSIPCAALRTVFAFAANGSDEEMSMLKEMNKPNEALSAVWALVPPSPKPSLHHLLLPQNHNNNTNSSSNSSNKGSRFAKFIGESEKELKVMRSAL